MDSNDKEEHEGPMKKSTCSPEHRNEELEKSLESVEPIIVPETRKKQKNINHPMAPSRKARGRKDYLVM
jgi:hypothetical protein